MLTNLMGCHALTAWRLYNRGALVEQRIKECYQLGFGKTAIDDRDGNAVLAALSVVAYNVLHVIRTTTLSGRWRTAQPNTLRTWLFRLPAKCSTHARKRYVRLLKTEPLRRDFLRALRRLAGGSLTTAHADLGAVDLIRLPSPCVLPPQRRGAFRIPATVANRLPCRFTPV